MRISSDYFIYFDIGIALIYLIMIIIGYKKGFLYEIISLIYTAASAIVAWIIAPVLASLYPLIKSENLTYDVQLISKLVNLEALFNTVLYFVITFVVLKLFYIVIAFVIKGMNKIPVIGKINQILGAIGGIVNATIITLILSMLLSLPIIDNQKEIVDNTLFRYINEYTEKILEYTVDNLDLNHIKEQYGDFDIEETRQLFKDWLKNKTNE